MFVTQIPDLLFLSIPCLGAGGFTLLTTNFQLSLLTTMAGFVIMATQACFGASGTVFRLFYAVDATSKQVALFLLCGSVFIWLRTFLLMPKMWVSKQTEKSVTLSEITPFRNSDSNEDLTKVGVSWSDLSTNLTSPGIVNDLTADAVP